MKMLLILNCQTSGLKNSIQLLAPYSQVDAFVFAQFEQDHQNIVKNIAEYDYVVIAPKFLEKTTFSFPAPNRILELPPIFFDAYHPDLCYLSDPLGNNIKGALGDYHSLLIYSAFNLGIKERDAAKLFHAKVFEKAGWLEGWGSARDRFIATYEKYGFDLKPYFLEWGRQEVFMHTVNHPAIRCVRDVAKALLAKIGSRCLETEVLPHDNLLNSAIYPVYPDIADSVGARGSYHFKCNGEYRMLTLEQFISASYDLYRSTPDVRPRRGYESRASAVGRIVEEYV